MTAGTAGLQLTFACRRDPRTDVEKAPVYAREVANTHSGPTQVAAGSRHGGSRERSGTARTQPRRAAERPLVLGRYRLHRRLGTGAFGAVWMARDEHLERDVAVKVVPAERIVGGRFEREAHAAARLSHPGIVTLYEAAIDDDEAYLVSELVRGGTLGELLEAGQLSDRDVVAIAICLCDALSHAHANGIVHRDLKPSNVLVPERPTSDAGIAKLTDFGVARVIGGDTLTRTGDVVGTAAYMAPEQAEGLPAGAAADLYALALVTYEALTGVNPVRAGTAAQRARRLGAYLPPLRRQRRDLPRELGRAVDLALRPRPRERGTVEELRAALSETLELVGDAPGVVTGAWERHTADERASDGEPSPRRRADSTRPAGRPASPGGRTGNRWASGDRWGPAGRRDSEDRTEGAWEVPGRVLTALAGGAFVGWVVAHLLAPSPIAPAAGALLAAVVLAALPRLGWIAICAVITTLAFAQGRSGGALIFLLSATAPILFLPRDGGRWALGAGAPALGMAGLAGAWPAFAARAAGKWRRAALGALGWWWLVLAGPVASHGLYLHLPPGTGPADAWIGSLHQTATLVLRPMLSSGTVAGAFVWALAAVTLPWVVRGGSLAREAARATCWALATVAATSIAIAAAGHGGGLLAAKTAAIGALASILVAIAPAAREALRARRVAPQLP
jgi:serine/threonine protein kinase